MLLENEFTDLEHYKSLLDQLMVGFSKLPKLNNKDNQRKFEDLINSTKDILENNIKGVFDIKNTKDINEVNNALKVALPMIVGFFKDHMENVKNEDTLDLDNGDFTAESKKAISKVHPVESKMHKLLGLKPEETITSKYKSGQELYNALSRRIKDHSKVTGMLAYAANINKKKDIFDAALHYSKKVNDKKKDA